MTPRAVHCCAGADGTRVWGPTPDERVEEPWITPAPTGHSHTPPPQLDRGARAALACEERSGAARVRRGRENPARFAKLGTVAIRRRKVPCPKRSSRSSWPPRSRAAPRKAPASVSDDTVEVLPSHYDGADFLVLFLNRETLLYNGDLAADRRHITIGRLQSVGCRDPRLLRERAEEQGGTWSFGRKRVIYYSEWKCA